MNQSTIKPSSRIGSYIQLLKKLYPWGILIAILCAVFVVRFVALNRYTAPSSHDYGYQLSMVHALHGKDVTGFGLRVPPLYFNFLDFFLAFLPVFVALKASASLASTIIAIPFFFIARTLTKRDDVALLLTLLFTIAEGYSEMIAWGGIPNLFGIFFMLWSIYFTIVAMEKNSKKVATFAGISLSLVVGTHHLTSFYYLIVIGLFTVLLLAFRRRKAFHTLKLLFLVLFIGALFSLPYLSIYISVYTSRAETVLEFNIYQCLHVLFAEGLGAIGFMFKGALVVWAIVAVLGFLELSSRKPRAIESLPLYVSSFALACFVLMFLISEHPTRPLYFLYIPILIAFGLFLSNQLRQMGNRPSHVRLLFLAFLVFISSFFVLSSYCRLTSAIDYYHELHNEAIRALDWVRKNTTPDAVFAVYDTPMRPSSRWGWWVEGYAERKAFMVGDLKFFIYESERQQVDAANKIFSGHHVIDNGYIRVCESFPVATINPEISVNLGTKFQNVLFFTDSNITSENLSRYIENGTIDSDVTNQKATMTYSYMRNLTMLHRTVELNAGKPYVDVIYDVALPNSTENEFRVWAWKSFTVLAVDSPYLEYTEETATVVWTLKDNYGEFINVNVTLFETNGSMNISLASPLSNLDAIKSAPAAVFTFNTTDENLYIKMRVAVTPKITPMTTEVRYFNAYELAEFYGIDYILLDRRMLKNATRCEGWWGEFDKQRLEQVFRNEKEDEGTLILEVLP